MPVIILLIGLFPLWGASAYFRCSDAVVRQYLVWATGLMLSWMILVLVQDSTDFATPPQYSWYLTYAPMVLLLLLSLLGFLRTAGFDPRVQVRLPSSVAGGFGVALALVVLSGVFFGVLHVPGVEAAFASKISVVFVILFTSITEISLQSGLLPSLSWSSETFRALPLDLRVVNTADEDVFRTGSRPPLSNAQVSKILRGEYDGAADLNLVYQVFPVAGGHGILASDVSVLRMEARALEEKQVVLRSKNLLLERDQEIHSRLAALRYEAQFLEVVEASLARTSGQIQQLLEALANVREGEERTAILERVRLLVSYSKARGRLVLAEHEGGLLTPENLELLVAQSTSDLRVAGIECAFMHGLSTGVSTRVAALLYDCLFDFALASLECENPVLLIHLSDQEKDGGVELRVAHGCDSAQVMDHEIREGTENLIKRLRGTFAMEGGPGALTLKIEVPPDLGGTR